VRRIERVVPANSSHLIVHPIVHVADELPDGVREIALAPSREFEGNILDASQWISVGGLAVHEFD
jgi:hypothetical protein